MNASKPRILQRGFTLVEILVVVFIIGTLLTIGVLSVNLADDDRAIRQEARKLMSLTEVARDEALFQSREFGIEFMRGAYRFVEYDPLGEQWVEVPFDELLTLRRLPDDYEIHLYIDDKRVVLDDSPKLLAVPEDERPSGRYEQFTPHIYIYSSGEMTPFELSIERGVDNRNVSIESDLLGNMTLISDDDVSG